MRWEGRRESGNVEDRRGMSPAMIGGGGGLITIVALILAVLFGVNPQQVMNQLQDGAGNQGGPAIERSAEDDEMASFAKVVLADTEDVWGELFPKLVGKQYQPAVMQLYERGTQTACGSASSAVGPFYCPGDLKVYLDLSFFNEMKTKFKAPGDFACAYVIAHEVGHHVQNLLGLSDKVSDAQRQARSEVESRRLSVRLELQADFLAGVWAHHAQKMKQILEPGDVAEAINAASQIGDDTLQKEMQGRVVPDSFTHGSSAQRIRWFTKGLKTGNFEDLNATFETPYEEL
jgi:uncharacterized protein